MFSRHGRGRVFRVLSTSGVRCSSRGGYSLDAYVATENRFLSRSHWIDACSSKWTFSPTRLAILQDGTLSLQVVDVFTLPVWKAQPIRVPGAWPVLCTPSSMFIWNPDTEDERDGFRWVKIASVTVVSDSYQVRPLDISAQSSDIADWAHTARRELISLTSQDDHGISANIIMRESRICHEHGMARSTVANELHPCHRFQLYPYPDFQL
jgi:hypothetical protein